MEHLAPLSDWQSLTLLIATVIIVYGLVSYFVRRAGQRRSGPHPLPMPPMTSPRAEKTAAPDKHSAPLAAFDGRAAAAVEKVCTAELTTPPIHEEPRVFADGGDAASQCARLLAVANTQLQTTPALTAEAAAALRDVVRLAAANGLPDAHATARLELGELARLDGDLITACEHWQIARGLFSDMKNKPRVSSIETRMREHGCPTDWVLNDF